MDILIGSLNPILIDSGYKYIIPRRTFEKKHSLGTFTVFLNVGKIGYDWVIGCDIGVRINQVEKILGLFESGKPNKYSRTYAESVYFFLNGKGGDYYCKSMEDVKRSAEVFAEFLRENMSQIESNWCNLNWLENLYNNPYNERLIKHKSITNTRMKGLILAKLIGKENFEDLVRKYDEELYDLLLKKYAIELVYPEKFHALVNSLRNYTNFKQS